MTQYFLLLFVKLDCIWLHQRIELHWLENNCNAPNLRCEVFAICEIIFEICEMIFEICEIIAMRATWDVSGGKSPKRFQPAPVPPCTSTSNDFTIRRNLLPAWQYRNRVFMKWVPSDPYGQDPNPSTQDDSLSSERQFLWQYLCQPQSDLITSYVFVS